MTRKRSKDDKRPGKQIRGKKAPDNPGTQERLQVNLEATDDGKMDFGGLPDIDLKKNLGCG